MTDKCDMCGCTAAAYWADDTRCGPCDDVYCDVLNTDALNDVILERYRQDRKWGGAENDARNTHQDWQDLLHRLLDEAETAGRAGNQAGYRRHMVEATATALAAVEAFDRKQEAEE